jgi:LPS export ABC transporter protein LptC
LKLHKKILYTVCFAAIIPACKNDLKKVNDLTSQKGNAEVSTDIEAIYSDSGKVKAKLTAPKMVRYITAKDPTVELPNGLKVIFYDKDMSEKSTLRANNGVRFLNNGVTRLRGNVVAVNAKGDTMNTEELFWNENSQRVYSNSFTKVRTKKEVILSDGFESNVGFTDYTFKNIHGIFTAPQ